MGAQSTLVFQIGIFTMVLLEMPLSVRQLEQKGRYPYSLAVISRVF